jgi:transposase InsO family protein
MHKLELAHAARSYSCTNPAKPIPSNHSYCGVPVTRSPRYLSRDRDSAFHAWTTTAAAIGIEQILTAPRSPWQKAYAERLALHSPRMPPHLGGLHHGYERRAA